MTRRRICVVTGSRADYGYLLRPMRLIEAEPAFQLQLAVTGSHLSPVHGLTIQGIEADGFHPDACVDMLLAGDRPVTTAKSVGLGVLGLSDALQRLQPHLLLVLGDRFEIFAAVQAAFLMGIPVAHLGGGDTTEGAFDEGLRHAITKLAHWHFPTNALAASRLVQMGEDSACVHIIGSTSLDLLADFTPLSRNELARVCGLTWMSRNILVTFHPATIETQSPMEQIDALLQGLAGLPDDVCILFTGTNADPGGQAMQDQILAFVEQNKPRTSFVAHLGQQRYYSALHHMDVVVGNSSSGLYEAPSFGKPTVNIGSRQNGRLRPDSVIDCPADGEKITEAIEQAFTMDCRDTVNPYGDGRASEKLLNILKSRGDWSALTRKKFHLKPDLPS